MVVNSVINNTKSEIPVDYTGTLQNGLIYLDDINYDLLDEDTSAKVKEFTEKAESEFKNGELAVFRGPLYNQAGEEILADGEIYIEEKSAPSFGQVLQGINIIE